MKIIKGFPPNFNMINHLIRPDKAMIFCYGDTIYNPTGEELPEDIVIHEQVHSKQQGQIPDLWWQKYLTDPKFREKQEVEAFAIQYNHIKNGLTKAKQTNKHVILTECLFDLAENLVHKYNLDISFGQAESRIRNRAKMMV